VAVQLVWRLQHPSGQQVVRLLLYADDLGLLAEMSGKLQQLLDALQSFCSEYDMQVHVGKQMWLLLAEGSTVGTLRDFTRGSRSQPLVR
jgi:hypothetical protein